MGTSDYCSVIAKVAEAKEKGASGVCMYVVAEHMPDFKVSAANLKLYHQKKKKIKAGAIQDDEFHSPLGKALGLSKGAKTYMGKPMTGGPPVPVALMSSPAPHIMSGEEYITEFGMDQLSM